MTLNEKLSLCVVLIGIVCILLFISNGNHERRIRKLEESVNPRGKQNVVPKGQGGSGSLSGVQGPQEQAPSDAISQRRCVSREAESGRQ